MALIDSGSSHTDVHPTSHLVGQDGHHGLQRMASGEEKLNRVWVSGDEQCGIFPPPALRLVVGDVGGERGEFILSLGYYCRVQLHTECARGKDEIPGR